MAFELGVHGRVVFDHAEVSVLAVLVKGHLQLKFIVFLSSAIKPQS